MVKRFLFLYFWCVYVSAQIPQDSLSHSSSLKADSTPFSLDTNSQSQLPQTQTSINVLNSTTGIPIGGQKILVGSQFFTADSDGLIETQFTPGKYSIYLVSDSLVAVQTLFQIDSNQKFAQWNILVQNKNLIKTPLTIKSDSLDQANMVITARKEKLHLRKEVSVQEVSQKQIQQIAGTFNDPLYSLKTLPGVTSTADMNVRPYVRGGDEKETRVFWNGIPLIQPYQPLSIFSVFNPEGIHSMKFYSGAMPTENGNSLSGALILKSKPAPLDTAQFGFSPDLLRSWAYAGVPIVKDQFGVYFSLQAFTYDWTIKRVLDIVNYTASSSEISEYQKYTELPTFKEADYGFNWNISPTVSLQYTGLYSKGNWVQLQPRYQDIFKGGELTSTITSVDTLALVEQPYHVQSFNLNFELSPNFTQIHTLAYQNQDWIVSFPKANDTSLFNQELSSFNYRIKNLYQNGDHLLNFGLAYDYNHQNYAIHTFRFPYELIQRGNTDLWESLGMINPEGYVVTKDDYFNDIGDLLNMIRMDYVGKRSQHFVSLFGSDEYKWDSQNKLIYGARAEYESEALDFFLAPRISWYHQISQIQEFSLAAGLYSQNNYELTYRHYNPQLKSEKAWHLNAEWSLDFKPGYTFEIMGYSKFYQDLAAVSVVKTQTISTAGLWNTIATLGGDTTAFNQQLATVFNIPESEVHHYVDSSGNNIVQYLPKKYADTLLTLLGERRLDYANTGLGWAIGGEVSLKYTPSNIWDGWVSAEIGNSQRQDRRGGNWYHFRWHRPWSFKWHNYFHLPSAWDVSVRADYSAGMAYTGFTDYNNINGSSDTVLVIEQKNNRNYSPVARADLRISQDSPVSLWGLKMTKKYYFGVINAFNSPNFFLTDSETHKFKWINLSWPLPMIYSGWEFRF